MCSNNGVGATTRSAVEEKVEAKETFAWHEKLLIWALTWIGYVAIRLIAPTLRYRVSVEDGGPLEGNVHPGIYVFWHRCVFTATHHFRKRGIVVMTSRSLDGEYIARIIEKFGYGAARGSSSRGGVRALLAMHRDIDAGRTVAFTIDGPTRHMGCIRGAQALLARPGTHWKADQCADWSGFSSARRFSCRDAVNAGTDPGLCRRECGKRVSLHAPHNFHSKRSQESLLANKLLGRSRDASLRLA
jgi:hypothetical protein